jgi:hypothetical protein
MCTECLLVLPEPDHVDRHRPEEDRELGVGRVPGVTELLAVLTTFV